MLLMYACSTERIELYCLVYISYDCPFLFLSRSCPTFPRLKNTCHDETVPTQKCISSRAYKYHGPLYFSFTEKMIVTQLVFAFCVGFSLTQEVSDKKDAIGLDGKDGAGSEKSE